MAASRAVCSVGVAGLLAFRSGQDSVSRTSQRDPLSPSPCTRFVLSCAGFFLLAAPILYWAFVPSAILLCWVFFDFGALLYLLLVPAATLLYWALFPPPPPVLGFCFWLPLLCCVFFSGCLLPLPPLASSSTPTTSG